MEVEIIEVAPRDGLQNEDVLLDTATKIELVTRSIESGVRRIEVTSFVNPKRVPQMADAEAVLEGLPRRPDVWYSGLVMNRRGLDRALAAGVREINFVVVTTETLSQRNQGMSIEESLEVWKEVAVAADRAGVRTTVTLAAAFGCPFEGEVPVSRLVDLAGRVSTVGPSEIALADTIGVGVPTDVTRRVEGVREVTSGLPLRCHFHNTRNTGIANAYAAVEAGVQALDASLGGIGGCPFAPAATGNISTEDLVYLLDRMDVATGIALDGTITNAAWLEHALGKPIPAALGRAGMFPPKQLAA